MHNARARLPRLQVLCLAGVSDDGADEPTNALLGLLHSAFRFRVDLDEDPDDHLVESGLEDLAESRAAFCDDDLADL